MTPLQILIILNILLGRLVFDDKNTPVIIRFFHRSIFTLLLMFFSDQIPDILIFIILSSALIAIELYWVKDNIKLKYILYMISVFIILPGIVNILEGYKIYLISENPFYYPLLSTFIKIPLIKNLITKINFVDALLVITCYLFTIKESTIIIRGILDSIKAVPQKQQKKDEDEYNRGKYIGILERTFIYFLIIFQQYTAIGILLGLKTFARFKELDKRDFAEYFLIGSLLSILTALLPAIYVLIQI